jgi:hypothetical protein
VTQRVVLIDDLVLQHASLSAQEILRQHGLHPEWPYDHEETVVGGGIVHRYTQPPRPRRPTLRPPEEGARP